jgi:FAD/FMN-containing dehydrogenase
MRTGMGAMPNNPSWHVYKRSLGPTLDQLFMQSNFGIVTKLGVWLTPQPECYMPLWLKAQNEDDARTEAAHLRAVGYSIHFHVWDADRYREILIGAHEYLGRCFPLHAQPVFERGGCSPAIANAGCHGIAHKAVRLRQLLPPRASGGKQPAHRPGKIVRFFHLKDRQHPA